MNLALIAHDKKKDLMTEFCLAYSGILSKHNLVATSATASLVAEATGLDVQRFLSGRQGGIQQLCARAAYNEIDLVIFLRDPLPDDPGQKDMLELMRLCDENSIPFASKSSLIS